MNKTLMSVLTAAAILLAAVGTGNSGIELRLPELEEYAGASDRVDVCTSLEG